MTTTWTHHAVAPRTWLLGNGETITEPPLEISGGGRRLRIQDADQSFGFHDRNRIMSKAARVTAAGRNTEILLETTSEWAITPRRVLDWVPEETVAQLHLVHDTTTRRGITRLWWRFQHQAMPYSVWLVVTMLGHDDLSQTITVGMVMPTLGVLGVTPGGYGNDTTGSVITHITTPSFAPLFSKITDHELRDSWTEFTRDNPVNWPLESLTSGTAYPSPLRGVERLRQLVMLFERLQSIQVPNFGDTANPSWLELEARETNISGSFTSDLSEYLDGTPMVNRAMAAYKDLVASLRAMGLDVADLADNDLYSAMLAAPQALTVEVRNNVSDAPYQQDSEHKAVIHVATGTIVVTCDRVPVEDTDISQAYEEALVKARLFGDEDELLAYAREYVRRKRSSNAAHIIEERS